MKFPVKENTNGKCLVCHRNMNSKFIVLSAGCLRVVSKTCATLFGKREAECFMTLSTHNHDARDVSINIVNSKSIENGQVDLYFCCTNCLQTFFDCAVSALDIKYDNANLKRNKK